MIIVTWYHIAITTVLVALAFVTAWNLRHFRRLAAPLSSIQADVLVSVLVPARNEERCIELCIRSLCAQTYSSMEVIVLDDGSTDSTPEILDALLAEFPSRLSVIRGAPLPEGWVGKPWACHQLALAAKGNVLLFTDADTMHQPTVVNAAVTTLMNDDIDFFSLVPYQEMRTWAEHAVIPMVHVLYTSYLPNNLILSHPSISLSAANGQFMCFKREAYEGIGGHSAVRNNIVEDIALAKALKRRGFRIALLDGHKDVSCRMYTSTKEVIAGFSKNFFPAMNFNAPLMVGFVLHLLAVWVFPWLWLLGGLAIRESAGIAQDALIPTSMVAFPIAQILIAMLIRLGIAVRFAMPLWHAFLMPLSATMAAAIGVNSMLWSLSRQGPRWKGRHYASSSLRP
jgi:chlorobactene glucosyltransferase